MTRHLIGGGTVVVSAATGELIDPGDVLIDGAGVAAVGPSGALAAADDVERIDARGHVVMPGLVNAHSHSYSTLLRGTVPGEPLDLFVMNAMSRRAERSPRQVYVASALHALELLKTGATSVVDHFRHGALASPESVDAAFRAYEDAGIRAAVAPMYEDTPYIDSLPIDPGALPDAVRERWRGGRIPPPEAYFELIRDVLPRWHGRHGRLSLMLGVDGPQRCTVRLLEQAGEFVARHGLGSQTHLLEAKTQVPMATPERGGSLLAHLDRFGLVGPRSSFAHFVWATDAEVALAAERGASIVHNPGSNLLLGSGIAPIARYTRAGLTVALGTDGTSGMRAGMFDQVKLAALLTHVTERDNDRWLGARDALAMATVHGARVLGAPGELGELRAGARADLVVIDARGRDYVPRGDLWSHLGMYETGVNVDTVFVHGEMVVRGGRHARLDEAALLAEAGELAAADTRANAGNLARTAAERPHFKRLVDDVLARPMALDRFVDLR
jgi:cytosine/adenosine deaminase-related metal-dependent hydrolase